MKTIFFIVVVFVLTIVPHEISGADDSAFCNDPKMWAYFESMIKRYPDDLPLQLLHAARIGLCEKIQANSIRPGMAIEIFNEMVDVVADKRGTEREDM